MNKQYIGARYVPLIDGEYNVTKVYEPLTVVLYEDTSYTSKKRVPAGILPTNTEFWALTGNYNAQVAGLAEDVNILNETGGTQSSAYGGSVVIYVDGVNGNDSNDGLEVNSAKQTISGALSVYRTGRYAQISIYLCGNSLYECPARIIENGAPHIYAYNGEPTIKFTATGGTGARFYNSRVHLEGLDTSVLNVDATNGGLYFENVALYAKNVNFKVPIKIGGNNATFENCVFDFTSGGAYNYALNILVSECLLHNVAFNITDGATSLVTGRSSKLRAWGSFTVKPQVSLGAITNYIMNLDSSDIIITSAYNDDILTCNFAGEYNLTSCRVQQTLGHSNNYTKRIGVTSSNTIWDIGDNYDELDNTELSSTRLSCYGWITNGGATLDVIIPYNIANHRTISITTLLIALRKSDGGYIVGSNSDVTSNIVSAAINARQQIIKLEISCDSTGLINNSPFTGDVFITGTIS